MYPSNQSNDPSTSHYPQQNPGGYFGNPSPPGATSSYPTPPHSGMPHSGVPYSGQPQSAEPFGSPQPTEPPTPKRGKTVPILSALTAILLVSLAITGGFFISHKSESDKTIADQKAQITKLQSDLDAKSKQLTKTSDELTAAEACMKAVRAFFRALNAGNQLVASKWVLVIDRDCKGVTLR